MFIPFLLRKTNVLSKFKWAYAIIGTLALGSVLLLSETTYGSKIKFTIDSFSFQPSELVKILFVLFLAAALSSGTSLLQLLITKYLFV
jgi:cell division protein FtsW (lipid II flippase)